MLSDISDGAHTHSNWNAFELERHPNWLSATVRCVPAGLELAKLREHTGYQPAERETATLWLFQQAVAQSLHINLTSTQKTNFSSRLSFCIASIDCRSAQQSHFELEWLIASIRSSHFQAPNSKKTELPIKFDRTSDFGLRRRSSSLPFDDEHNELSVFGRLQVVTSTC